MRTINAFAFGCTELSDKFNKTGQINKMQPSTNVEMQLLLCKHCLKHHVNKQQQNDSNKISQKECNDSTNNTKLVPSTLTKKKQTKNNSIINNPSNIIDTIDIDKHRTTTFNDDANALNTFDAMQSILNIRNNQIIENSTNQLHCHDNIQKSFKQINSMLSRYYYDNDDKNEQSMIEYSENGEAIDERLTSNQFKRNPNDNNINDNNNQRIASQKSSFYTFCTNQSDKCFSDNLNDYSKSNDNNNRPKSHVQNKPAHSSRRTSLAWSSSTSTSMKYSHVLLLCLSFFVFGMRNALVLADETPANSENALDTSTETGICSSRDIRNSVSMFNELRGCRVIEGFLMLTLIEKYNETDYDNLTFPELTEITEFLILYRVNGLKTLANLFPNLRIIRGNSLIADYSFIIYEMMHLQEIGLKSLTQIARGSVRIEKNPALCFVDTIDWSLITLNAIAKENIFKLNKPQNECPKCPNNDNGNGNEASKNSTDSFDCPISTETKERLCWNRKYCQKICPSHCGNKTCNEKGLCCDDQCLGCQPNNTTECLTCRYFSVGQYPKRQCVQKCPSGLFAIQNHRCVTAEDCRKFPQPINVKFDYVLPEYPYIPIDGDCTITCPYNHYPDGPSGQRVCRKCSGSTCRKECPAGIIDSKAKAQQYKGCTHITGSLIINIKNQGGNIVRELDVFLSDIEEIQGFLSVVRSYPLISLSFFKNLKRIHGQPNSIGLRVVENQNLQALFPENSTVIVEHGRLFFHFNPKLCMNIINDFKKNVVDLRNVSSLSPDEVAPNSNGDKIACIVSELNVTIVTIKSHVVLMNVIPMVYEDERQLLGYLVYYMPAPYQNVTMFDGRDACGSDGWSVEEIAAGRNVSIVPIFLTHLKPFTQYAYYVRTYTVASEQRGGMTKIKYFTTAPDKPEQVTRVSASINGNSSSEILVKWGPPVRAHGNLTKYVIKCSIVEEDEKLLEQRNYCNEPLGDVKIPAITTKPVDVKPSTSTPSDDKCSCDENGRDGKGSIFEKDAEQLIEFEDELHNTVYVWQEAPGRQRRGIPTHAYKTSEMLRSISRHKRSDNNSNITNGMSNIEVFPNNVNNNAAVVTKNVQDSDDMQSKMDPSGRYYRYFYTEVNASVNSFLLTKLKHYTYYGISVKACRWGSGDNCGTDVFVHQRTGKIEEADDVKDVSVQKLPPSNHSIGVILTWKPPENPNGIIVSYVVRYQRVDVDHTQYHDSCIAHNAFRNQKNTHTITEHLSNGNFSFMVVANSLAGPNTRWSKPIYQEINEKTLTPGWIILILLLIIILIVAIGGVVWFYRRKYGPPTSGLKIIASVNPEYVSMQYTPDEWEIPRENIIQFAELGQGSFGMVYEGILMRSDRECDRIRCAIKTVNENATDRERINFLKEASVMKAFDTHHVVHLLGVVSRGQPVLVVMELMALGDLKGYLRSHRPESGNDIIQPPSLHRILQMAIEIADGMAYLSAKKFVHRDLAARNCMVAEDLTVKIGDFGMTRDIYETDYYRKGTKGLLPVRWMAPESLKDGVFSSSSDVFSFGIVLWEMSTLASQPYQGLSNDQVLRYVIDGGVMERPENCPEKLYNLMCKTWQHRPSSRPTFIQIVSMLLDGTEPHFREVSFYHSTAGQELVQLPQHQVAEVVDVRTPLRAEEENFSVGVDDEEDDPEDPNSFLMEKRSINQAASTSGTAHSPLRTANKSQIPDVALSKQIPKIYSHHLQMSLNPRTSPPVDPEASSSSATQIEPSSLFTMPNNVTNVFGRNGIKSNYTALAQQKYTPNSGSELNETVADNNTTSYCNHIV